MTNYSLNTTGVVGPYVSKEQIGANPSIMSGLNQSGQFTIPVAKIQEAVLSVFDLRPAAIIRDLNLLRPIYSQTAAYGHFGRELPNFTWEATNRVDELRAAI